MAKWLAAAVIHRMGEDGEVEYLVVDTISLHPQYKARSKRQTKNIGGTEDGHPEDKNVLHTLRRELNEESNMVLPWDFSPMIVHTVTIPGHFKNFYLIPFESLTGTLRTEEKTIDFDKMSPPYWLTFEEAKGRLYGDHNTAVTKAHERLSKKVAV